MKFTTKKGTLFTRKKKQTISDRERDFLNCKFGFLFDSSCSSTVNLLENRTVFDRLNAFFMYTSSVVGRVYDGCRVVLAGIYILSNYFTESIT